MSAALQGRPAGRSGLVDDPRTPGRVTGAVCGRRLGMRPLSPSPSRVNLGPNRCRAGFRGCRLPFAFLELRPPGGH